MGRKMMGKMSKEKGKRGEREAAKALGEIGIEARRAQQFCGVAGDADLITSVEDLHMEVKRVERLNLYGAIEQADGDRKASQIPVVLHRKNGKPFVVIHYLKDWPRIAEVIPTQESGDNTGQDSVH
jgi:Holliday junction resolvase